MQATNPPHHTASFSMKIITAASNIDLPPSSVLLAPVNAESSKSCKSEAHSSIIHTHHHQVVCLHQHLLRSAFYGNQYFYDNVNEFYTSEANLHYANFSNLLGDAPMAAIAAAAGAYQEKELEV